MFIKFFVVLLLELGGQQSVLLHVIEAKFDTKLYTILYNEGQIWKMMVRRIIPSEKIDDSSVGELNGCHGFSVTAFEIFPLWFLPMAS